MSATPVSVSEKSERQKQLISTAEELCSNTVPSMVIKAGLKRPQVQPGKDTWWVVTDPDEVHLVFTGVENLAIPLGSQKDSPVIAVGMDIYKSRTVIDKAKSLGVTSNAAIWITHTGRGGITNIYRDPGIALRRDTRQEGSALDLLTNGYTLIPPSSTHLEPDGGGPYTWHPGHSPFDIPFVDLEPPPQQLLEWWQELHQKPPPAASSLWPTTPDMPDYYQGPIPEGTRNTELASRAGYLHRKIPNDALVSDLVHAINIADCKPPLVHGEVENILKSILPRAGASHLRGVPRLTPLEVQS